MDAIFSRRYIKLLCVNACLLALVQYACVAAADSRMDVDDYFELSLEDLANITVTTASLRDEDPLKAPGVVTVITSGEIKQYGARTLRDVLDRVVNAQVVGSHFAPHGKFSLRGVNQAHVDSNTLFLLNGRPMRDGITGGYNADLYHGFPTNIIERIEIVRGPGSVLYGTNAVAGVLNIITKKADKESYSSEMNVSAGSHGYRQSQVGGFLNEDGYQATFGLSLNDAEGDDFDNYTDERGNIDTYKTGAESYQFFAQADVGNFHVNTLVTRSYIDSGRSIFILPSKDLSIEREFLDLEYENEISDSWHISMHYTRTEHDIGWSINETRNNRFDSSEELAEVIFNGSFSDDWNAVVGWTESKGLAVGRVGITHSEVRRTGLYAQTDYTLGDSKFIAGFQWNDQKGSEKKISPRVGFIHEFSKQWHLKLLYGEAFRAPYNIELFFDGPALVGDPNLKPETMKTYDAQLIYKTSEMYHALTLFHSKQEEIITRDGSFSPPIQANIGEIIYKGIELESKVELVGNIHAVANLSHQSSEDETGADDNTYAPFTMFKLGFNYNAPEGYSVGVYNSFFDDVPSLDETFGNPAINPDETSYSLLSVNAQFDTGKLWGIGEKGKSVVSVYLDNLFDEAVYTPDLNHRGRNNTIPQHWGRGAYVTYSLRM